MNKIVGLICLLLIATSSAFAGEIIQTIHFSPANLMLSRSNGFDVVHYDYHPNYDRIVGYPSLPELPLRVVIPPSATVTGVEVIWADEEILPGKYLVMPVQAPRPFSATTEPPFVGPSEEIYSSKKVWPAAIVDYRGTGSKAGFRIGTFGIFPVRYVPAEQKLIVCNSIRVKISYQEGSVVPLRQTARQIALHSSDLATLVENAENIALFAPPLRNVGKVGSQFLPAGNYEHVILTPAAYKDTFQVLADWRTAQGIPSKVFCIESTSVYPGSDVAEKMRNFLQDADTTWGTVFAFIARGDIHSPLGNRQYRRGWAQVSSYRDSLPCDLYYSDLFRGGNPNIHYDWNGDGDNIYGEVKDTIDYYSDIYVGMVTLDDAGQAHNFMRKIMNFEANPDTLYFAKGILLNGVTFSDSYLNNIYNAMTRPPWVGVKMYQSGAGHTTPSAAKFRDSVNAGFGYSAIIAHGSVNSISIPDAYTKSHVAQQTGTDNLNTVIAVCCHPGAFHSADECLAESMAVNTGGFSNVMMNSSYGWVNVAEYYDELFFYKFMPLKAGTQCSAYVYVGQALARVKDHLVYLYPPPSGSEDNKWKWESFEKNLFGEPANHLPNWTPVTTMAVVHANVISTGLQDFTVTVSVDNFAPLEDALVCVWKDDEVYDYGLTDASGEITFSIHPTTPGQMLVTCTERNHLRYEGTVTVQQSGISEPDEEPVLPIFFALGQNKPNPCGKFTSIAYQIPTAVRTKLMIYDATGRLVRTLVDKTEKPGFYSVRWDRKNDAGRTCAAGLYFYRIEAGEYRATKSMLIVR